MFDSMNTLQSRAGNAYRECKTALAIWHPGIHASLNQSCRPLEGTFIHDVSATRFTVACVLFHRFVGWKWKDLHAWHELIGGVLRALVR
jgi:hypothetical protein